MRVREALEIFSGANVSHPTVPLFKLQKALMVILSAARREADRQDKFIDEVNKGGDFTP
jgi:hypothetical protein